jgi:hypothetical protein
MINYQDAGAWRHWVFSFELERSGIVSTDHFRLVDQGRMHVQAGNLAQARAVFEQAYAWALQEHLPDARRVQAEATLYLGDLARLQNDGTCVHQYEQARFLFEALSLHNVGVATHRLATWLEQNDRTADAWREYDRVLTLWRELAREHGRLGNRRRYQKYSEQIRQLELQIDAVVLRIGAQPATRQEPEQPRASQAAEPAMNHPVMPPVRRRQASFLSIIPIYTDLAAGSGIWLPNDEGPMIFAEIDHVIIEDHRYTLTNLLNEGTRLRLSRGFLYAISKAQGNSMNLAGIENGDYVLYRTPQDHPYQPTNGDIVVAAVTRGDERYGTIKRYQGNAFPGSLEPVSTEHHERIPIDPNVEVIGQVIAVLKPADSIDPNLP